MDLEQEMFIEEPDEEFVEEPMGDVDIEVGNAEFAVSDPMVPDGEAADQQDDLILVETGKVDLETLANDYTGYAYMNQILFIADHCPPLKIEALKLLVDYVIKNTQNVRMLETVYKRIENLKNDLMFSKEIILFPEMDTNWADQTRLRAAGRLESYIAEFKRQKDEGVKESIRRSLDDLFFQYVNVGDLSEALKLYGRGLREYCTTPNFFIQMLIHWINVTIYAGQWNKLSTLLPQAERTISELIERDSLASTSTPHNNAQSSQRVPFLKNYKELVQTSKAKIAAATGLFRMQEKNYKLAAEHFLAVDVDVLNYTDLISSTDVAIYGTLCALATFNRSDLKDRVIGNTIFRKALESEPRLIELLHKFCRSQFGHCQDILNDLKDQLLLNIYISPHVQQLYNSIRLSWIIQYFDPYITADINQMAEEFRSNPDDMENELISLIQDGLLKARIDSYNKIIHAKFMNKRNEIYNRILSLQKELDKRAVAIMLRASLQCYQNADK